MIVINLDSLVAWEKAVAAYPDKVREAAKLAINQTAKREALSRVQRDMLRQVNFKSSYLRRKDRTGIGKFATKQSLIATIYARDRPTMLNQFRPNPTMMPKRTKTGKSRGVVVKVKPNSPKLMKRAFVHQFKGGNMGVMVRTAGGASEPPNGITNGGGRYIKSMRAWLLYAPSIDQVMFDTAERNRKQIQTYLVAEFLRQFNRLK